MTDPLPDTWHHRDLPVLREVVRLTDERMGQLVKVDDVEAALDLDPDDIQRAGLALKHAGLCKVDGSLQRRVLMFSTPTADARRLTGAWPSTEQATDRLIAALTAVAERDPDVETRSSARAALDHLGHMTRDTITAIAATVITGQLPGAAS